MFRSLLCPVLLMCVSASVFAQEASSAPAAGAKDQAASTNAAPSATVPSANDIIPYAPPQLQTDFIERDVMIPMRDGVKLYTVIMIPKAAKGDAPIVLTRTPYNAAGRSHSGKGTKLINVLPIADAEFVQNGYIRVYQDIRGKYGSEGDYTMTRHPRGPMNASTTDDTTDAYDTIDWLVKNTPESNGRVGMIGSSYEGWTVVMALLGPHPALKVAAPESPMVDGWMGDDWFHYGAYRQTNFDYFTEQMSARGAGAPVPRRYADDYEEFLRNGSAGDYAQTMGLAAFPFWQRLSSNAAYDEFWQAQALDRLISANPPNVPTIWEQGLWDQEDMWGANHSYLALKAAGHAGNNWLVMGPWFHSQVNRTGYNLGPLQWDGDTAKQFRQNMIVPMFNQYLKDGAPANLAHVTVYNTGDNHWDHFDTWPPVCEQGCSKAMTPFYLHAGFTADFVAPGAGKSGDSYVSDPARPVPFEPRPVKFSNGDAWRTWLVMDQRYLDGRPDVLMYESEPMTTPVKLRGAPVADLFAATTGTDGDFVVRVIDVYPPDYPANKDMAGYELPISSDIFRGRYRTSFVHPAPIKADRIEEYKFELPNVNHVILPGHRIMVEIESTLFPLYDRNPQTFVPNIFFAKPEDYRKATVTIYHDAQHESSVLLPVVQ